MVAETCSAYNIGNEDYAQGRGEGSVCFAHIVVPSSQKAVSFARCADESCRRLPPR